MTILVYKGKRLRVPSSMPMEEAQKMAEQQFGINEPQAPAAPVDHYFAYNAKTDEHKFFDNGEDLGKFVTDANVQAGWSGFYPHMEGDPAARASLHYGAAMQHYAQDAGTPDAGTPDAGTPDAGTPDAGTESQATQAALVSQAGTPQQGQEALAAAQASGQPADLNDEFAKTVKDQFQQTRVKAALDSAPALTRTLNLNPSLAVAIKPEVEQFAFLENWIHKSEGLAQLYRASVFQRNAAEYRQKYDEELATYVPDPVETKFGKQAMGMGGVAGPSAWAAGRARAAMGFFADWHQGQIDMIKREQSLNPKSAALQNKETTALLQHHEEGRQYWGDLQASPAVPSEQSPGGQLASEFSGAVTGMAPLLALSAVGSPWVTFAGLYAMGNSSLRRQGVSEGWSTLGAATSAFLGAGFGGQFKLAEGASVQEIQTVLAQAQQKLLLQPTIANLAALGNRHLISGVGYGIGMSMADNLARRYSEAQAEGRLPDPADINADIESAIQQSVLTIPIIMASAGADYHERTGRYIEAHAHGYEHDTITDPVAKSKLADAAPDAAKDTIKSISTQVEDELNPRNRRSEISQLVTNLRTLRDLEQTLKVATEQGGEMRGPLQKAVAERHAELTRWIDPEVFKQAAEKAGYDATTLGGDAYTNALESGSKFPIDLGTYLIDWRPLHEHLREGVSLTPDGATLHEVNGDAQEAVPQEHSNAPLVLRQNDEIATPEGIYKIDTIGQPDERTGKILVEAVDSKGTRRSFDLEELMWATHQPVGEQPAGAGGAPPGGKPPPPAGAASGGEQPPPGPSVKPRKPPEYKAPTKPVLQEYAEREINNKPVGLLAGMRQYAQTAGRMSTKLNKLVEGVANRLGSASQYAQAGVEEALAGAKAAQDSAVATESVRGAEQKLKQAVSKIVQEQLGTKVSDFKEAFTPKDFERFQSSVRDAVKEAVKANVTPENVKKLVDEAMATARDQFKVSERKAKRAEQLAVSGTKREVKAGDLMDTVYDTMYKRNLNAALETARQKALKQAKSLNTGIQGATDIGSRELFYKADAKILGPLHDLITESVGLRTARGGNGLRPFSIFDPALDMLKLIHGQSFEFDRDMLREAVQKQTPLEDLTLPQLQNFHDALKNLKKISNDIQTTTVNSERVQIENSIAKMAQTLVPHGVKDVAVGGAEQTVKQQMAGQKKPTVIDFAKRKYAESQAIYSNAGTLLTKLGDWGKSTFFRVQVGLGVRDRMQSMLNETLAPFAEPLRLGLGNMDVPYPADMQLPANVRVDEMPALHRRDVWAIAGKTSTEEGMKAYVKSWGMTPEAIHEWLLQHMNTETEWRALDKSLRVYEPFQHLEAAVHANRGDVPMNLLTPRVIKLPFGEIKGGYWPQRWLDRGYGPAPESPYDALRGVRAMQDTDHAFTKDRVKFQGIPDNSFDNIRYHHRLLAHDIAFSEIALDMKHMFEHPDFKDLVTRTHGPEFYDELRLLQDKVATGTVRTDRSNIYVNALYAVKGAVARAAFNFNLPVGLAQGTHYAVVMSSLGINPIDMSVGIARALTPEGRKFARENSVVVPYRETLAVRKQNIMFRQMIGDKPNSMVDMISYPSQVMYHAIDQQLSHSLWLGLYEKYTGMRLSHEEARQLADSDLARAMPSLDIINQPRVAHDPVLGMFMLVRNFPTAVWNLKAVNDWERDEKIIRGEQSAPVAWGVNIAQRLGMMGGLWLGKALMGHVRNAEEAKDEKHGWEKWAVRSMVEEYFYGNLVANHVLHTIAPYMLREKNKLDASALFGTTVEQQGKRIIDDLGYVTGAFLHGKSKSKAVFGALDAAGRFFGVPPPAVLRPAEGVYKIINHSDFRHTPHTSVGVMGKAFYGDTYDTTIPDEIDHATSGGAR